MIRALAIRDLVVIADAQIEPAAGLTAITGETGAGKTVLAQALALLAGAPADQRAVRPGARFALVEATLALPDGFWDALDDDDPAVGLRLLVEAEDEVAVARRIPAQGRARSLVDGQAAPREAVASLVGALLRFSGQHAQRRLVTPARQLAILDGFAGPAAVGEAARLAALRRALAGVERDLRERADRRERARLEREALAELADAVERAALDPTEEAALLRERERLRHHERLVAGLAAACDALSGEGGDGGEGAVARSGAAAGALADLVAVAPELDALSGRLVAAQEAMQEVLLTLRREQEDLDANPGRLDVVEERLAEYQRLGRRYGPGTDAVLARAEEARAALSALDRGAEDDAALEARRDALRAEARAVAAGLRATRAAAAGPLAERVGAQLADLALPAAALRVELDETPGDPPADRVTVHLRANPGLPEAPLAEAASGGELSRVLLALQTVAAAADASATWIFDEVDAGIGGVTATAVAAKLAELACGRQVLVITHLPQVAAAADRHYRLVKGVDGDGLARTTIERVTGDALVGELCRMLGASPDDPGARQHATELLAPRAPARGV